jgi:DNA-directed RNA polymerase specialized sigma24 family protein
MSDINRNSRFATTHWSRVLTAGEADPARAREAMELLCSDYWYPLYVYVRRKGYPAADAEDLVQGFFARLLSLNSMAGVQQSRGRFRSFLLASLDHYLADEWDRSSAQRRDVRRTISLDAAAAETRFVMEPEEHQTPERAFERQWAMALLEAVVGRLRREYAAAGKDELFMSLRFAITADRHTLPYTELAGQLHLAEPALRVAIHRLRRRYRELIREEIARTVASPDEVEEELHSLMAAMG